MDRFWNERLFIKATLKNISIKNMIYIFYYTLLIFINHSIQIEFSENTRENIMKIY